MGKTGMHEVIKNGRVYLFNGNKYAGSRSASAKDIPTAAETLPGAFLSGTMNPTMPDYSAMMAIVQAAAERTEAEALVSEAEKYGINLDDVRIDPILLNAAYVRSNHSLLLFEQRMRTEEGQLEMLADETVTADTFRVAAGRDNASVPFALGLVHDARATEKVYAVLAEHPDASVRHAVATSPQVNERTRQLAAMAYTATNEEWRSLGYKESANVSDEALASKAESEVAAVFHERSSMTSRESKGVDTPSRAKEQLRRRTYYAAGLLDRAAERGCMPKEQTDSFRTYLD